MLQVVQSLYLFVFTFCIFLHSFLYSYFVVVRNVQDYAEDCLVFVCIHILYLLLFISYNCFKMGFVFVFTEFLIIG